MSASALDSPARRKIRAAPRATAARRPVAAADPGDPLARAFSAAEGARSASPGWCLRARDNLLTYVANNTLSPHARKFVIGNMLGGAALAGLRWAGGHSLAPPRGPRRAERVARRLAPLCLIGPLPLFFHWQLWYGGRELTFLVMICAFLLGLQALTRVSLETPPILPRTPPRPHRRPRLGAAAGAARRGPTGCRSPSW